LEETAFNKHRKPIVYPEDDASIHPYKCFVEKTKAASVGKVFNNI
jgi:hypothetical protein